MTSPLWRFATIAVPNEIAPLSLPGRPIVRWPDFLATGLRDQIPIYINAITAEFRQCAEWRDLWLQLDWIARSLPVQRRCRAIVDGFRGYMAPKHDAAYGHTVTATGRSKRQQAELDARVQDWADAKIPDVWKKVFRLFLTGNHYDAPKALRALCDSAGAPAGSYDDARIRARLATLAEQPPHAWVCKYD